MLFVLVVASIFGVDISEISKPNFGLDSNVFVITFQRLSVHYG